MEEYKKIGAILTNGLKRFFKSNPEKEIFEFLGLNEPSQDVRTEEVKYCATRYPTIYSYLGSDVVEGIKKQFAVCALDRQFNEEGTLPEINSFHGKLNLRQEDLEYSADTLEKICILDENSRWYLLDALERNVEYRKTLLKGIENTIGLYENGGKPTPDQILRNFSDNEKPGSITEPYLQGRWGGTPREGLSKQIDTSIEPTYLAIYLKPEFLQKANLPLERTLKVEIPVGDIEEITQARKIARRYYDFIEQILKENPKIGEVMLYKRTDKDEKDEALKQYADCEWKRRSEALDIAKDLQGIYGKQLTRLEQLYLKLKGDDD